MDLNNYIRILRRHWRLLTAVVLLALAGSAAAAWSRPTLYATSTTLVATVTHSANPSDETGLREVTTQRAATLAQFAGTSPVQQAVLQAAAAATGEPAHAPAGISINATGGDPFVTITVTDQDPRWAQAVANSYRQALPAALQNIDASVAAAAQQLNTLTPAPLPQVPVSPNRKQYLVYGGLLGIIAGIGLIVLREAVTRQMSDPEDIGRALGLSVLGAVPQEDPRRAVPMRSAPHSARAEAYRSVLANMPSLIGSDAEPQSLLITSTSTGEGASTLAANLAVALARSGRKVLLVDANLRDPQQHAIFDLPESPGLAEVLAGHIDVGTAAHVVDGGSLEVLTAGEAPPDPVERLTSATAHTLLASIGTRHDVVVFDSPPVVPVADTLFLARQVSSVVLVTRLRVTNKDRLRRAGDALYQVRAPLMGVVVNGTGSGDARMRPTRRHARPTGPLANDNPPAPPAAPAPAPPARSIPPVVPRVGPHLVDARDGYSEAG